MAPSRWRVFHHRNDGLVLLLIRSVKLNGFWPHLVLLTSSNEFWNHEFVVVGADVVHQSVGSILAVQDTQFSVDTVVSAFKRHTLLHQLDQFINIAELLIEVKNVFEVIWLHNNMLSTKRSHSEFLGSHTSEANSFPHFWHISFLGSIESILIFL